MKKLLSLALAIAIIVCAIPLGTFTFTANAEKESYYTYTVSNNKATITDVSTSIRGNITIPSTLGGYPVTSIGKSAFSFCDDITSIKLPDSIEDIGYFAFDLCEGLSEITVDEGNQYFSAEEGVLFNKNKTEIVRYPSAKAGTTYDIPKSVQKIATSAFARCKNLTNISIGNEVTNVSNWAFEHCTNLVSVTISEGVTRLGEGAFGYCYELRSVTLPSSITTTETLVFFYCDKLTIYGQEGSYAERYALNNNIPFQQVYYKVWENMSVGTIGIYEAVLAYGSDIEENETENFQGNLIDVFDKNGKRIKYNDIKDGYPLVENANYTIKLRVDFDFTSCIFTKKADTIFADTASSENGGWYNDAVTYAVGAGLITGYGGTNLFGTADRIQRQDFVVILARLAGVDLTNYQSNRASFTDVPKDAYYEKAIMWAADCGITTGYGDGSGRFGVGDNITREQLVTFLYRYAKYKNGGAAPAVSANAEQKAKVYADYNGVTDYAQEAIIWALDKGVITGQGGTHIAPAGNALRCEVAKIIYNIYLNDIF